MFSEFFGRLAAPPPPPEQPQWNLASLFQPPPQQRPINPFEEQVAEHGEGRLRITTTPGDLFVFFLRWNQANNAYDCIIEQQPDYRGRSTSPSDTHRLPAEGGGRRICFAHGKAPRTVPEAIKLSLAWAELTSLYIRNGIPWN